MKKIKTKLFMSLSVIIIGFLISTSSLNNLSTKALLEEKSNYYKIDSFDSSTWKWTFTKVVSTESTGDSFSPSLVVDTLGNIHIAWDDVTDYAGAGAESDIFYKRWDAAISSWTTTEIVSTESTGDSFSPSLAIDSTGNLHVAWYDFTDYAGAGADQDIFYKRWDATSSAWTTTEVVSTESTSGSGVPSLAVDTLGNIHIVWPDVTDYAGAGAESDIFYKRWEASSSSWNSTEIVSMESTDKSYHPSLVVDTLGNAHIAWDDCTNYAGAGTDYDVFYKHRDAFTTLWTITEVVSTESTEHSDTPSLAVDTLGNVHIAWIDLTNYAGAGAYTDIFYKHWNTSSSLWTTTEVVSTESTEYSYYPSLAVDSGCNVHVAWGDFTDYSGARTDYDIFYKRWSTFTSSWITTEVVSTESTSDSYHPSLAVDTLGNVHIAWYDSTVYSGSGPDQDIFYKLLTCSINAPELAFIVPNPTELPTVYLDWNNVLEANTYYVYRSTSYIWFVEGLIPIASISSSEYNDILPSTGFYYYVIIATNFAGNSSHSNCQYVYFEPPTTTTEESSIGISVLGIVVVFSLASLVLKKRKLARI